MTEQSPTPDYTIFGAHQLAPYLSEPEHSAHQAQQIAAGTEATAPVMAAVQVLGLAHSSPEDLDAALAPGIYGIDTADLQVHSVSTDYAGAEHTITVVTAHRTGQPDQRRIIGAALQSETHNEHGQGDLTTVALDTTDHATLIQWALTTHSN